MPIGRPPLSTPRIVGPGRTLAVLADRAYEQPTTMQPGTFCYR